MDRIASTAPDVVLIHCHDLGRFLGTYGMPHVPSRHIDQFAAEAVVFENAHAAAPLCSPARGALFTGLSPYRNGIQGLVHDNWRYREGVRTIPERLRAWGYRSTLIGLQHENVDSRVLGFDECAGLGFLPRAGPVVDATESWLANVPDRAERAPIFLTVGTWEVHRPWPSEDYAHADPDEVDVPPFLPDTPETRQDLAAFYGSVAQFDEAFGRLVTAVDSALDPTNTMIILTTDHGAAFPRAKSTLYDAGTGVALVVRPPMSWDVAPGRVTGMASHLDILPTLLELAGSEPDDDLEGRSLLGPLRGDGEIDPERVLFTSKSFHDGYDPKRAARSLSYTYVRNYTDGPALQLALDLENSPTRQGMGDAHLEPRPSEELYDRATDPHELVNLAEHPEYEHVRRAYADRLNDWLDTWQDPIRTQAPAEPPARSREIDALPALPARTPTNSTR